MNLKAIVVAMSTLTLAACGGATTEETIVSAPTPVTSTPVLTDYELDIIELNEILMSQSPDGTVAGFAMPDSLNYTEIPQDILNPLSAAKVQLGKMLYHETGMTAGTQGTDHENTYSCASCHNAQSGFKSGIVQGVGEGGMGFGEQRMNVVGEGSDTQPVTSPTILNTAYQEVMLWNGQFGNAVDGIVNNGIDETILSTEGTPKQHNAKQWSGLEVQAIAGLGVHRLNVGEDSPINTYPEYQELVDEIGEPDLLTVAAQAIAAFERTVLSNEAPFQQYVRGNTEAMSHSEIQGAKLFFGDAGCSACHTGPALSSPQYASEDEMFFAVGFGDLDMNEGINGTVDEATRKGRGGFTGNDWDNYKFKVPTLYNLKDANVFGHGGTFTSVREVVEYKNAGVPQADIPLEYIDDRFNPLGLSQKEVDYLVQFIEGALHDDNLMRYVPESLPSGNCVTNNDDVSREQLGCN